MKIQILVAIALILVSIPFVLAHDVATGDLEHDQNLAHIPVAPEEMPNYENSVPFVLVFFAGLIIFAFVMGSVLGPKK